MKKLMTSLALLATLPLLGGCELIYNVKQDRALSECAKIEDVSARQDCVQKLRPSYEESRGKPASQ